MSRFPLRERYKNRLYLKYYNPLQLYKGTYCTVCIIIYNNELIWSIRDRKNKTSTKPNVR